MKRILSLLVVVALLLTSFTIPVVHAEVIEWSQDASLMNVNDESGVTYKLTSDIGGTLTLTGQEIAIDLAGHTWQHNGTAIILSTGSIHVYDSVGGGTINVTAADAINMGNGTALFENITIKAGGSNMDAIFCDGGNLTVNNCTLSGPKAGINVCNSSEAADASARSVVTVNGGTFANYDGADKGIANCAIEIRNNADEITLNGDIKFENNKILSISGNTKSIEEAITIGADAVAAYTAGATITENGRTWNSATIAYTCTSCEGGNTGTDSDVVPGDLNGDGAVNARDIVSLRRSLTGGYNVAIDKSLADFNLDETVNAKDVVILRRFTAGGYDIELPKPNVPEVPTAEPTQAPATDAPTDPTEPPKEANIVDGKLVIADLPSCGSFTDAGFDASQKFLNFQSGGENSDVIHSIGIIDLSKYKEIIITYGNDGSAAELGFLILKTATTDLVSMNLNVATGWKNFASTTFDVSALNNREELFFALASAKNGFAIAEVKFVPVDSGNENPGDTTNRVVYVNSADELSPAENVTNVLASDIEGAIDVKDQNYVIDLAGHKWTNANSVIALSTGSVYVYDSVGGGSIVSTGSDTISMGNGTAKFKNITIEAQADSMDAIYCDGGNLTVERCTLVAPKAGINVANGSEAEDSNARAVVTVINGTFAKSTVLDSQGRNCAIELRNNADEITLSGDIKFENNIIISKSTNTKSIEEAITIAEGSTATFTDGDAVDGYETKAISYTGEEIADTDPDTGIGSGNQPENPGDNTPVTDPLIVDIENLATSGSNENVSGAVLNYNNGAANSNSIHSIGVVDLSKYKTLEITYSNEAGAELGVIRLKTASASLQGATLPATSGWGETSAVYLDLLNHTENEELFIEISAGSAVISKIKFYPIESGSGEGGEVDPEEPENPGVTDPTVNEVTSVDQFLYDGTVNKLTANITGMATVDINATKGNLVVDLNGFKWENSDKTIELISGTVSVYDSSEAKTGTMKSTGNDAVSMGQGEASFKDITIIGGPGGADAIFVNGGTVTVENCTLSAGKAGFNAANDVNSVNAGYPVKATIIGGKFALYGEGAEERNCAIELRNNASNITLSGDITFENNVIISKAASTVAIKDAITAGEGYTVTFTAGSNVQDYVTATVDYKADSSEEPGNPGVTDPTDPTDPTDNEVTSVDQFLYDGTINKLTANITGMATVDMNATKGNLVVDLNGFKWENSDKIIELVSGKVSVYDSSEAKTGTMKSTGNDAVSMGQGEASFKDITIIGGPGGADAIFVNGGTVTVENCTLSAGKAGFNAANDVNSVNAGYPVKATIIGGKFALYGEGAEERNCAIELRNNASNITLSGDITFENNVIISKAASTVAIKDAITAGEGYTVTFTAGSNVQDYVTATVDYKAASTETPCEHTFTNYVSNNDATCEEDGTKTATCDKGCGATETIADEGSAKGHSYTNYVSDNNATTEADGTKTATCDNGCGTTDTVIDEGSKLPTEPVAPTDNEVTSVDQILYDGTVNKFTADVEGAISVNAGQNVVIDLNGHKWTNGSKVIDLNGGAISVYDSSEAKTGTISATGDDTINIQSGNATFKDITVYGAIDSADAIFILGGNVTVENCTVSAGKAGINVDNTNKNAVVNVKGGKFANYSGVKDSNGRNCAIELRNNASNVTLSGDITFETNVIISKAASTIAIKDAITAGEGYTVTFTAGDNIQDYVTATVNYGETSGEQPDVSCSHSFTNYVSNNDATCEADGTKTATCDKGCGETETITDEGSAKGHSYTNYVSDNNATTEADGTKTATCDNGCGSTNTVTDEGSKIPSVNVTNTSSFLTNGTVNKLASNISGQITVSAGQNVIVDLNGYKWSNSGLAIIVAGGTLNVYDSSSSKTGTISATGDDTIKVQSGNATFKDITIFGDTGSADALFIEGGNVTTNNCTLSAGKAGIDVDNRNGNAVLNVIGGKFANYSGVKDSNGRNCAIEIRNDADKIFLSGNINFENPYIMNKISADSDKTAAEAITIGDGYYATYVSGNDIGNENTAATTGYYWTSTIMYGAASEKEEIVENKQNYYFSQSKTDIAGSSADKNTWIYMLDESRIMVREVTIDSGLGGAPVNISQLSDLHFNYCNAKDIAENDPVLMSTLQNRQWLKNASSVPNAVRCLEMASTADQMVITGDVLDYLSWGCIELMDRHIWSQYPNALVTMGNHEAVKKMQGTVDETTSLESRIDAVAATWKHDAFYTSKIVNDKVMVIQLDNGVDVNYPGRFWECQIEPLTKDLALAREKGYSVLLFYHIPIATNNSADSQTPIRVNDAKQAYFATFGDSHDGAEDSQAVYNIIYNNADIIDGAFCGHLHSDFYTEFIGKDPNGAEARFPQYVLTGTPYDMGHLLWITVK